MRSAPKKLVPSRLAQRGHKVHLNVDDFTVEPRKKLLGNVFSKQQFASPLSMKGFKKYKSPPAVAKFSSGKNEQIVFEYMTPHDIDISFSPNHVQFQVLLRRFPNPNQMCIQRVSSKRKKSCFEESKHKERKIRSNNELPRSPFEHNVTTDEFRCVSQYVNMLPTYEKCPKNTENTVNYVNNRPVNIYTYPRLSPMSLQRQNSRVYFQRI